MVASAMATLHSARARASSSGSLMRGSAICMATWLYMRMGESSHGASS
jgi:hypothetical protein